MSGIRRLAVMVAAFVPALAPNAVAEDAQPRAWYRDAEEGA